MSYITVHRTYCSPCYKNFIKNSQWIDHQEYVPPVFMSINGQINK